MKNNDVTVHRTRPILNYHHISSQDGPPPDGRVIFSPTSISLSQMLTTGTCSTKLRELALGRRVVTVRVDATRVKSAHIRRRPSCAPEYCESDDVRHFRSGHLISATIRQEELVASSILGPLARQEKPGVSKDGRQSADVYALLERE